MLEAFSVQGHAARDSVTLSGDIFRPGGATALRSLTLAYCDVDLSSPLFRAPLLSLCLVNCLVDFPLEVLSLLPQLRTLILENTHGVRVGDSSNALRLPQLQHLELINTSDVIVLFLQAILIPS